MGWDLEYPLSLKDDTHKSAITKEDSELDLVISRLNYLLERDFISDIEGQAKVINERLEINHAGQTLPVCNIPDEENASDDPEVRNALKWARGGQISVGSSPNEWAPATILREVPDDAGQAPLSNSCARIHSLWALQHFYGAGDDTTALTQSQKKRIITGGGLQEILIKQIIPIGSLSITAALHEINIYCEPSDPTGVVSLNVLKSDNLTAVPVTINGMSVYPSFAATSLSSTTGIPLGSSPSAIFAHIIFQAGDLSNLLTATIWNGTTLSVYSGAGVKDAALNIYLHSLYTTVGTLENVRVTVKYMSVL